MQRSFTLIISDELNNFETNIGDLVRYIKYQQQVVRHSQVRSVFDLLYKDYAEVRKQYLDKHGRTSEWDSESLAESVVNGVLQKTDFSNMSLSCMRHVPLKWLISNYSVLTNEERLFVMHPWSHVDLLIYDSIGKMPLLGVEVDGLNFHQKGSIQAERDQLKNLVFDKANIRLVRLLTTGSKEDQLIETALREVVHC